MSSRANKPDKAIWLWYIAKAESWITLGFKQTNQARRDVCAAEAQRWLSYLPQGNKESKQ